MVNSTFSSDDFHLFWRRCTGTCGWLCLQTRLSWGWLGIHQELKNGNLIVISWGFSGKNVYSKTKKHGNIMGIGDMIWSGDEKYGDLMGM